MSALTYINFTNPKTGQSLIKARDGQGLNLVGAPVFRAGEFWNKSGLQGLEIAEAVTNLIPADVDPTCKSTAGLATGGANTLAVSSLQALFEGASILSTYQDNTTLLTDTMTLPTTSVTYSISMYIWVPQDWDGGNLECSPDETTFTSGSKSVVDSWLSASSPRETWFRLTATLTVATDVIGTALRLLASSAPTAGRFVYIDGLQIEQRVYTTPFHPSNVNARLDQEVRIPVAGNFPGIEKGSIIISFRPDWAYDVGWTGNKRLFAVQGSEPSDAWNILYLTASDEFWFYTLDTVGNAVSAKATTHSRGDKIQIVAVWDATNIQIFVNGSAGNLAAKTRLPSTLNRIYLGNDGGTAYSNLIVDELAILDVTCNIRLATKLYNNFLANKTIAQLISI